MIDTMRLDERLNYAWAAGYIDGEGCFDAPSGRPRLRVINTHRPSLEHLRAIFLCGTIQMQSDGMTTVGGHRRRTVYRWQVNGGDALNVCSLLRYYLREKRSQAEALVELGRYVGMRTVEARNARERIARFLSTAKRPDWV